jgi:SAM-dependent methyltransferase
MEGSVRDRVVSRQLDLFDGPFGAVYAFYIERPLLPRTIGRLIWGGDARLLYDSLDVIATVPDGGTIVDAPCGSGVALRGLRRDQAVRYVAVDLSSKMLQRARANAARRGLGQVDLREADVTRIPIADASADLFLSHGALHCLPEPPAALVEAARCLRAGGRLAGTTFSLGGGVRQRLLVRPHRGGFGPIGTRDDLRTWLERAGFADIRLETSGPLTLFKAKRLEPKRASGPTASPV